MTVFTQDGFDLRVEWGIDGVRALGPHCAVVIVVDVLVFTTTVDVVLGRGGRVLPLPWHDERAARAAEAAGATLTPSGLREIDAGPVTGRWTLRPSSLVDLPAGTFLGISSPNGATLCAAAEETGTTVLAGCLRNATAVAAAAADLAGDAPIGVVACGERWRDTPDKRLRPGVEDWLGAGAIAAAVPGRTAPSPEARLAAMSFHATGTELPELLRQSVSGRELITAGVPDDVRLASEVDASKAVPVLTDGIFA
jgi:2-phosphosulfolactate phosphatase